MFSAIFGAVILIGVAGLGLDALFSPFYAMLAGMLIKATPSNWQINQILRNIMIRMNPILFSILCTMWCIGWGFYGWTLYSLVTMVVLYVVTYLFFRTGRL
jgi:hypothetical protein